MSESDESEMSESEMVEELADLIRHDPHTPKKFMKNKRRCRNLVLSMEQHFIDFLQNEDTSPDGIMELRPMNSYDRLLLHHLANIFGFDHESVGEGDERHLILKRCPETSIPSTLVSDILGQYDDYYDPTTSSESEEEDSAVEKLAFKIKDNLQCKHLVLSMEKVFTGFLQDDTSSDGILELQPMDTYSRHLMHLLADIYGFSHESVGEGDDRHLVLERFPETSIPSILVSDILHLNDDNPCPTTSHQPLGKTEVSSASETNSPAFQDSLDEKKAVHLVARELIFSKDESETKESVDQKPQNVPVVSQLIAHALGHRIKPGDQDITPWETEKSNIKKESEDTSNLSVGAYQVARERIFSKDESETKESVDQKPQNVPIVSQLMIAHALGQSIKPGNQDVTPWETEKSNIKKESEDTSNSSVGAYQGAICQSSKNVNSLGEPNDSNPNRSALQCERKVLQKPADANGGMSPNGQDGSDVCNINMKEQHMGAAKRMFVHAFGLQSAEDQSCLKKY